VTKSVRRGGRGWKGRCRLEQDTLNEGLTWIGARGTFEVGFGGVEMGDRRMEGGRGGSSDGRSSEERAHGKSSG